MKMVKGKAVLVDNGWVVPHNSFLLMKYNCHLNVESVHSIAAVKYLYKYVTKGPDRASFEREVDENGATIHDEVKQFEEARYFSGSETFWRIYSFEIHTKNPQVSKLPIHGDGEQTVQFETIEEMRAAAGRGEER